jgi:hypothetical protein
VKIFNTELAAYSQERLLQFEGDAGVSSPVIPLSAVPPSSTSIAAPNPELIPLPVIEEIPSSPPAQDRRQ